MKWLLLGYLSVRIIKESKTNKQTKNLLRDYWIQTCILHIRSFIYLFNSKYQIWNTHSFPEDIRRLSDYSVSLWMVFWGTFVHASWVLGYWGFPFEQIYVSGFVQLTCWCRMPVRPGSIQRSTEIFVLYEMHFKPPKFPQDILSFLMDWVGKAGCLNSNPVIQYIVEGLLCA